MNAEDLTEFRPSRWSYEQLMYTPVTKILIHFISVMSNVFCNTRGLAALGCPSLAVLTSVGIYKITQHRAYARVFYHSK
jgi:hypothetical protein